MAGEAKTNAFLLSSATVMIGPQAEVFTLNPAEHSIGLVKNFTITSEPAYTELTQGVQNVLVYSVLTSNPVRCSMEVYEYNSKNLAYGLGLDGSTLTAKTPLTLKTAITSGGVTVVANSATDPDYNAGDYIIIQEQGGDQVHVAKLASDGTFLSDQVTLTLTAGTAIDTDTDFTVGALVSKVNQIQVGSKAAQPFLSAKIVGILPENNRPITILIPKMRITRGFSLAFTSENFGNLPYEFSPYEVTAADALFSEFKGHVAKLLTLD